MAHAIFKLLTLLDEEAFLYRLDRAPPDAIMISFSLGSERLEITVSDDEKMRFVRFTGDDNAQDASAIIAELYRRLRPEISS